MTLHDLTIDLTPEEKAANAIIWIDGLKTTKVKQGIGELGNSKNGYCCLGYGCKLLGINYEPTDGTDSDFSYRIGLSGEEGNFQNGVIHRLKRKHRPYLSQVGSLVELNDDINYSFRRISTFIKKNLEDLFEPSVAKLLIKHYK